MSFLFLNSASLYRKVYGSLRKCEKLKGNTLPMVGVGGIAPGASLVVVRLGGFETPAPSVLAFDV